jgi:hypothetical protein
LLSPGGAGSNNWTIIFNGDIDLSVIMTFVSTMSSLCNLFFVFNEHFKTITKYNQSIFILNSHDASMVLGFEALI